MKRILLVGLLIASSNCFAQEVPKVDISGRRNDEKIKLDIKEKGDNVDSYFISMDTLGFKSSMPATREGINKMKEGLYYAHKEFRTGTYFFVIGSVGTLAGLLITPIYKIQRDTTDIVNTNGTVIGQTVHTTSKPNYTIKTIVSFAGALLQLIGGILWVDSHKFIGQAGNWHFEGDKIIYRFGK